MYKHKFRNRLDDNKWHKLPIIRWYNKRAVQVLVGNFRVNIPLVTSYVKILNNDYVKAWGLFINKKADSNLNSYYQYKSKRSSQFVR